ncbi:MAG TPA: glycosyltransferase family 4 protein [Casimicrobiaceae bacterium]|nr:glycosyltransferase family 4 protein [Casimicrobiaceae bacterium]
MNGSDDPIEHDASRKRGTSDRLRLLFVSPRFLFPAASGGKIRTRDVLRGLKGGRFAVDLVSPACDVAPRRFADDIAEVCDRFTGWPEAERGLAFKVRRALSIGSALPLAVATDRSSDGAQAISAALQQRYDLVVCDFPHASVLLPPRIGVASLLFTHNVEAEIFRRHAAVASGALMRSLWLSQARKMAEFEDQVARRFETIVAVSERDAAHFARVVGADNVRTIPTGVDLDYFTFAPAQKPAAPRGGRLIFTGSMDWLANRDAIRFFIDAIWSRIVAVRPEAEMVVVGHSPPRELVELATSNRLRVTFTGFVDDVRVRVRDAHVYVIPLRVGGGTRIKAFEAMAMGCPVVTTSLGVEGLPIVADSHALFADDPEAFAAAVLRLLDDASLRERLSRAARSFVEQQSSFRVAAQVFEDACVAAVARRQATAAGIPQAA